MTNYSRTTLRELKKRYLNILKKCLLANLMAFSFALPSMAEETWNEIELTTQIKTQADVDALNLGSGNTKIINTTNTVYFFQPTAEPITFDAKYNNLYIHAYPSIFHNKESVTTFKNIKNLTIEGTRIITGHGGIGTTIIDVSGNFKLLNPHIDTGEGFIVSDNSKGYIFANKIDIESRSNALNGFGDVHLKSNTDINLINKGKGGAAINVSGGNIYLQGKTALLKSPDMPVQGLGYLLIGGYVDEKTNEKIITPFDSVIIESEKENAAAGTLSRQQSIYMYSGGITEIHAKNIELNAYNKESSIASIGAGGGSKIILNATENLTINGGIGVEGNTGSGNLISLTSTGGNILVTGDVKAINSQSKNIEDTFEFKSSRGGTIEIKGKILNEKDNVATASLSEEKADTGVFITLDESTLKLHKDSEIEEISSNKGVIDLTNTTGESAIQIASLGGEGTTIQVASSDTAKTTIGNNKSKKLSVKATSKMNDEMNNPNALVTSLASLVEVESGNQEVKLEAEEGKLAGRFEGVALNGNVTKLRANQNTVTESVKDVMGLQVLSFRNQINDVQKRMGDLRLDENLKGTWVRTFGGDVKFGDMGLKNKYNTIQAGADFKKGNAYFGIMASLTEGESDMDRGTGEDKTYGMGVYAGYMTDNGWYVDATAKQMHLQNKFKARYNTGELSRGSYKTWGTSVSLEAGKRMNLPCGFFVEPQAEIMYGRVQGINYATSAGVKVEQEAFESLIGRAGLSVGKTFKDKGSVYANVSVLNDFAGKVKTTFSYWNQETKTRDDMGGAWTEFAVGGTYKLNKNTAVYGEFATSKGTDLTNPVQWSLGLRFSF